MAHHHHRHVAAEPLSHLTGIIAGGVDHLLTANLALRCGDHPFLALAPRTNALLVDNLTAQVAFLRATVERPRYRIASGTDEATLGFSRMNGLVVVPVSIDGAPPRPFVVDSGAGICVLFSPYAKQIGVEPRPERAWAGAVGGEGRVRLHYGMSGRAYDPRFLFSWPNSRISVMSGESAAETLWMVGKGQHLRQLPDPTERAIRDAESAFKRPVLDQYARESDPYYATARLWDDGILDPVKTRTALGLAFAITGNAKLPAPGYGTFRM